MATWHACIAGLGSASETSALDSFVAWSVTRHAPAVSESGNTRPGRPSAVRNEFSPAASTVAPVTLVYGAAASPTPRLSAPAPPQLQSLSGTLDPLGTQSISDSTGPP